MSTILSSLVPGILLTIPSDDLLSALDIPLTVAQWPAGTIDVHDAWAKYKACKDAWALLYCMKAEGTWHIQQPTSDEIVVLFISKSSWPENYMKLFPQAETFEDLVDWLKQSADAPMNMELWGV
jgi:hypothetical protein